MPALRTGFTAILADAVAVPQGVVDVYLIVAVPAATPVTKPVVAFTVATAVLLLLQVPPLRPLLLNVAFAPAQTVAAPLTVPALGSAFTVIIFVAAEVPQLFAIV